MKQNILLLFFVLAKFWLNYSLFHPVYELHRDEFLHLDQGNHLEWGYLSVPPLTSWLAVFVAWLGNTAFWVRFFPCLFGALTLVVVWKAAESLGAKWFGLVLAAVSILFSGLLRLNMLFQPNSFEVLAWTFIAYCFVRHFQDGRAKWLYFAGVAFGFGLLNKYNIAFFAIAFFAGIGISRQRRILSEKSFWISCACAFAVFLPNLAWQAANGFPFLHHMKLLNETQLVNVSAAAFLLEQLAFFFGSIHIVIAALAALAFYKPFRQYRPFLWSFFIALVVFAMLHAKSYYAIGLYPILIAFGSAALEKRLVQTSGIILRGVALALPIGFFVTIYELVFSVNPPEVIQLAVKQHPDLHLGRWEDGLDHGLPQDFADMLGWKELSEKVARARQTLPAGEHTLILCDNYGQAGAINYYLKAAGAVTMNADYVNWFDLSEPVVNIVLVQEASDDDPDRKRERDFFESVERVGTVNNKYAREKGTAIYVLKRAKVDVNAILESEIRRYNQSWKQ